MRLQNRFDLTLELMSLVLLLLHRRFQHDAQGSAGFAYIKKIPVMIFLVSLQATATQGDNEIK